MISWLKFYFLGFFSDKYAEEGATRSFWNAALSFALMLVIISTGFFTGYVSSFKAHYSNAESYREFLYNAFGKFSLEIKGGKACAALDGAEFINGFTEDNEYSVNGYRLVVDTRPAETAFDDVKIICKNSFGEEISYEEYYSFEESKKKDYTVHVEYTGKNLDVTLKQSEYENFLENRAGESGKTALAGLKEKLAKGDITEKQYADSVYVEYVKSYYPSLSRLERYGEAPTLKTYYLGMVTSRFSDKFLMILEDVCVGSFKTEKGLAVDFEGYFTEMPDKTTFGGNASGQDVKADADGFIMQSFESSSGFGYFIFFINFFKLIPIIFLVALILALALSLFGKYRLADDKYGLFGSFKVVSSFVLVSALVSFIASVALSFFCTRSAAYIATVIVFNVVLMLRTAVFIALGWFRHAKKIKEEERQKLENNG